MLTSNQNFGYTLPIKFTLEEHLKNYAEVDTNVRSLLESYHTIREKMKSNLRTIIMFFPHYSEHDQGHSERIISAIERLLGRKRIEKLSPADTWLILVCAYMHDLGMIIQGKELEKDWQTVEFKTHVKNCLESVDDELKDAALRVGSTDWTLCDLSWPVHIYRSVILLTSEFYRKKHPERSKVLPQRSELKEALDVLVSGTKKIPRRIKNTIGKICYSHGISFEAMLDILDPIDNILDYAFHPRFVAALLCLGDLCDLDNGRFNNMAIESVGGLTKNNLIHYYKHESVTAFVIDENIISVNFDIQREKIREEAMKFSACRKFDDEDFRDFYDKILIETRNWINWMINITENIKLHWNELQIDIETLSIDIKYKILIDGRENVYSNKNMRFSFSKEKAFELIEGYSLYNDCFIFIRELLQNSFDALKKQFWRDILSGRWDHVLNHLKVNGKIDYMKIQPFDFDDTSIFDYYRIKINVEQKDMEQTAYFSIEDNGVGISKDDLEERIVNTGNNDYKMDNMPEWLKPTSAFGIGLHSVFAITETIFIETRTGFDKNAYYINMHSSNQNGYIFMNIGDNQDIRFCDSLCGTKIHFKVDMLKCKTDSHRFNFLEKSNPDYAFSNSEFCNLMIEALQKFIPRCLFNLVCTFNGKNVEWEKTYESKYIELLFNNKKRNYIFNQKKSFENYDYAIDETGRIMTIWNRPEATLMVYYLDSNYLPNYRSQIFCKEFCVNNTTIPTSDSYVLPIIIDFWGNSTRKMLNLSRDKLTYEQIEYTISLLKETENIRKEIYFFILKGILEDESIDKWHEEINLTASILFDKEKEFGSIINYFENKVNLMIREHEKFIFEEYSMKILILKHIFSFVIKKVRGYILKAISEMSMKDRLSYIADLKILEEDNQLNLIIRENTYFYEYLEHSTHYLKSDDLKYFLDIYILFTIEELFEETLIGNTHINLNDYIHEMIFKREFGDTYISKASDNMKNDLMMSVNKIHNTISDNWRRYYNVPINVFFSTPLTLIINYLLIRNQDLFGLEEKIRNELSYVPGYNCGYGFLDCKNVGDIFINTSLRIKNDHLKLELTHMFPFVKYQHCKSIEISNDNELIFEFDKSESINFNIKYSPKALKKFLDLNNNTLFVPGLAGFEDITIIKKFRFPLKSAFLRNYFESGLNQNYSIPLWDKFRNIKRKYKHQISNEEDAYKYANDILSGVKDKNTTIFNLLHFIYQNSAYKSNDFDFKTKWDNIFEIYKKFVFMILKFASELD